MINVVEAEESYVTVPTASRFTDLDPVTYMTWIRVSDYPGVKWLMYKGGGNRGIYMDGDGFIGFTKVRATTDFLSLATIPIPTMKWVLLVVTLSGSTVTMYTMDIDGNMTDLAPSTAAGSGTVASDAGGFVIGTDDSTNSIPAFIASFTVLGKALSEDEIKVFAFSKKGLLKDCLGHWWFNPNGRLESYEKGIEDLSPYNTFASAAITSFRQPSAKYSEPPVELG